MLHTAVKIKTATVGRGVRSFISICQAVLDDYTIGFPRPDTHRAIPFPRHVPAVVRCGTVIDEDVFAIAGDDTISAMIVQVCGITRIIFGAAARDADVMTCAVLVIALNGDPRGAVVMRKNTIHGGERTFIDQQAGFLKSADIDPGNRYMTAMIHNNARGMITVFSSASTHIN